MRRFNCPIYRKRRHLLREAWFLCRHFWLVQGGNSWEVSVYCAAASNGWMDAHWSLDIRFEAGLEKDRHPSTSADSILYPQGLYADVIRVNENNYGLRVYVTDRVWKEIANPKAENLTPE